MHCVCERLNHLEPQLCSRENLDVSHSNNRSSATPSHSRDKSNHIISLRLTINGKLEGPVVSQCVVLFFRKFGIPEIGSD